MKSSKPALTRRRRRIFALVSFSIPLVLLLLLELGLRQFGLGNSYPLFVPVREAPEYLRANRHVVRRFIANEADTPNLWIRPVFFPRRKTPSTFRIFVQGGSTAEGYPYGYVASPSGMLQQRLQRTFPQRRIEVITTAMSAVNSYTLLDFADEIIDQNPDAVLIYAGHNEYVGVLGVGSGFSVAGQRPIVLAFLWLRDLRIFQLAQQAVAALWDDPEGRKERSRRTLMATIVRERRIPYGSPLYQRGLQQYRANLRAILSRYRKAGVPVLIGTVVSNERDQPPFISGHGPGTDVDAWRKHFSAGRNALQSGELKTALREFGKAVQIDDLHAEGHYALGGVLERLGRYPEARQAFLSAKDRDELRFRAPEEINRIIREVAAQEGARVVEVRKAFARTSDGGIVGSQLMLEHLHPNLRGYFLIADAFYEALRAERMVGSWDRPIPRAQAWEEMPVSEVDRLYGQYRIRYLTSDWPFTDRKKPFRIAPTADRVERIAQAYYRGRYQWPDAMRKLLNHYRLQGNAVEGSKIAVLLAEAFPYRAKEQSVAAELLLRANRPGAGVYLERALEMSSAGKKENLQAAQRDLLEGNPARAILRLTGSLP